jgi:2,4-dienoyl-CoA reductase-like NADH-dependent reductase (Old Yellow Enzyme family)
LESKEASCKSCTLNKQWHAERANKGQLMVTEATEVSADGHGYPNTPGIYTEEQMAAWKPIVAAVKATGAIFFCQIWHCGRASHSVYKNDGAQLL